MEVQQFYYDNKIVKNFIYATLLWGVVGMIVGLLLAFMFLFPNLTDDEWLTGNSPAEVVRSISEGNVSKGMVPYKNQLSEKQILQLASYILITLQEK